MSQNVLNNLAENGINLKSDWIAQFISHNDSADKIFRQFCFSDLRISSKGSLPKDIYKLANFVLQGCHILQVQSAEDIHKNPTHTQSNISKTTDTKRCLKLTLTDGNLDIVAVEYSHIPQIEKSILTPLTKLLIFGKPTVRRGTIFLSPSNIKLLLKFETLTNNFQSEGTKFSDYYTHPETIVPHRSTYSYSPLSEEIKSKTNFNSKFEENSKHNKLSKNSNETKHINIEELVDWTETLDLLNSHRITPSTDTLRTPLYSENKDENSKFSFNTSSCFPHESEFTPATKRNFNLGNTYSTSESKTTILFLGINPETENDSKLKDTFLQHISSSDGKDRNYEINQLICNFPHEYKNKTSIFNLIFNFSYLPFKNKIKPIPQINNDQENYPCPTKIEKSFLNSNDSHRRANYQKDSLPVKHLQEGLPKIITLHGLVWSSYPIILSNQPNYFTTSSDEISFDISPNGELNETTFTFDTPGSDWNQQMPSHFNYWALSILIGNKFYFVVASFSILKDIFPSHTLHWTCEDWNAHIQTLLGYFHIDISIQITSRLNLDNYHEQASQEIHFYLQSFTWT